MGGQVGSPLTLTVTVVKGVFIDRHSGWLHHTHFELLVDPEFDLFRASVGNLWSGGSAKGFKADEDEDEDEDEEQSFTLSR